MAADPSIALSVKAPVPFNGLEQLGQLRAQQQEAAAREQEAQLRQQQLAQNQQRLTMEQTQAATLAKQQQQTQEIHTAADQAYQQINGGNAEQVLSGLKPEVRTLAEGWLSEFDKSKRARAAQGEQDGKAAAKFIQATDYNPVVAATSIKLLSDLHPEAAQLLDHVTDPAALKKIVDHFATLGDAPKADFSLGPNENRYAGTGGAPIATGQPKPVEPSPAYREFLDYQKSGGPLDFNAYQNMDANRKRPVSITNAGGGENTNVKDAVQGMIDGTIPPQLPGRASKDYIAILSEAKRKGYDLSTAVTDWNATQKHMATLNNNQQTKLQQSIQTAASSVDVIDDLAKQWDGGKYPALNSVTLKLAKGGALGPKAQTIATQLDGQITDVTSELAQVYMGGGTPTDQALKLAQKNLQSSWSKQVLLDMTDLTRKNLKIRSNSMKNVGVQGASATNPYAAPQGTPAAAPTTAKPDPLGIR